MEVHVTGELEAKLTHSAAQQGRNPDDLVQDVLTSYFEEEARFIEAVNRGEDAFERGEYRTHEQAGSVSSGFYNPDACPLVVARAPG
jgi:predicted transcriptional regulator